MSCRCSSCWCRWRAPLPACLPDRSRALRLAGAAAFVSLLGLLAVLFTARAPLAASGPLSYALGGWGAPLGIELRLDGISWLASLLAAVIGLAVVASAWGEGRRDATFYFLFLMLVTGLEAAILTTDIFNLFVAVEILSVSTYLLIAAGGHGSSLRASLNYLLISSLGMMLFLVGALLAYSETGSLSMPEIAAAAAGDLRTDGPDTPRPRDRGDGDRRGGKERVVARPRLAA